MKAEKFFENKEEVVNFYTRFTKAGGRVTFVSDDEIHVRNALFQQNVIIKKNNNSSSYTGYFQ